MLEHGTALVPTLINIENFPGIADAAATSTRPTPAHMRDLYGSCRPRVGAAREAGVPIYAGTDAGSMVAHGRIADEVDAHEGGRDDRHRGARRGVAGMHETGWADRESSTARRPTWSATRPTRAGPGVLDHPDLVDPSRPGVPADPGGRPEPPDPGRAGHLSRSACAVITPHLTREDPRTRYAPGTEFAMDVITMIGNTGTYLDSPFHRYADGADLAGLDLATLVGVARRGLPPRPTRATRRAAASAPRRSPTATCAAPPCCCTPDGTATSARPIRLRRAVPHRRGAQRLIDAGAVLVGIDSVNIDDTESGGERPAHTLLLGRGRARRRAPHESRCAAGARRAVHRGPARCRGVRDVPGAGVRRDLTGI